MHLGQGFADRRAVLRVGPAHPQAVEKGDNGGGPAAQGAKGLPVLVFHRLRTGDAARRQMLAELLVPEQHLRRQAHDQQQGRGVRGAESLVAELQLADLCGLLAR